MTKFEKETFILDSSMINGIRMKEFLQHLKNSSAKIRSFPHELTKQLSFYAIPTLVDETPNRVMAHENCYGKQIQQQQNRVLQRVV